MGKSAKLKKLILRIKDKWGLDFFIIILYNQLVPSKVIIYIF